MLFINPSKYKYHHQDFDIEFPEFPTLTPVLLNTKYEGFLKKLQGANSPRYFKLSRDWHVSIQLNEAKYDNNFISGTLVIPVFYGQSETRLDGASVPLPWLVSFLSFGLLRPLGIMLIASIVHDFAFQHGGLLYLKDNGEQDFQPLRRDLADKLFHDIIRTVNQMPVTAVMAWLAVRLGWFYVKYAGEPRGGKFPWIPLIVLIAVLLILAGLILLFGLKIIIASFAILYLLIFACLKLSPDLLE